jgi:hypothetical protein
VKWIQELWTSYEDVLAAYNEAVESGALMPRK